MSIPFMPKSTQFEFPTSLPFPKTNQFAHTSVPFHMQRRQPRDMDIPPPGQPMWVPFAGTKRKAEDPEECPPPPKQFAISDEAAAYVLKDGYFIRDEDEKVNDEWNQTPPTPPQFLSTDEEMEEDYFDIKRMENKSGVDANFDDLDNGGEKLHEKLLKSVDSSITPKVNDLKGSPKLYLFEGLSEVLSEKKRNADLAIPRSLLVSQAIQDNSMAMVLWKPPGISTVLPPLHNSGLPTPPQHPTPVQLNEIHNMRLEDDDDKDGMDIAE